MAFLYPTEGKVIVLTVDDVRLRCKFVLFAATKYERTKIVKTFKKKWIDNDPDKSIEEVSFDFTQ
jgi:hypothetical protein